MTIKDEFIAKCEARISLIAPSMKTEDRNFVVLTVLAEEFLSFKESAETVIELQTQALDAQGKRIAILEAKIEGLASTVVDLQDNSGPPSEV